MISLTTVEMLLSVVVMFGRAQAGMASCKNAHEVACRHEHWLLSRLASQIANSTRESRLASLSQQASSMTRLSLNP